MLRAWAALPPKVRSAFLLSQLDGLTYAEIADRLGVSLSSAIHDSCICRLLPRAIQHARRGTPESAAEPVRIDTGRQGLFDHRGRVSALTHTNDETVAWTDGFIVANRMRPGELVTELDRYMQGKLRCEASGELRSHGVELEARSSFGKLEVIANYAYTDARTTKSNTASEVGQRTSGVPYHTASTWAKSASADMVCN